MGVLNELGKNEFPAVQAEGAERIARLAAAQGISRMVHLSSIGADADAQSEYSRTKAQGEAGVLQHMPGAVILRPSIIFGTEDQFFNRFASMARMGPFLPLVGSETQFQPVYVDDVAQAAVKGILGQAAAGVYELGGPEVKTFLALMQQMLEVIHRRRIILGVPFFVAKIMAGVLDIVKFVSFQLFPNNILTRDQLKSLRHDNVVSDGVMSFKELGIEPTTLASVLPEYLWKFRPSGQYDDIQNSANNLRT